MIGRFPLRFGWSHECLSCSDYTISVGPWTVTSARAALAERLVEPPPQKYRNLSRMLHRQHLKSGGAPAGDAGWGIFHHQRGPGLDPPCSQQVRVWRGLMVNHVFPAHNRLKMMPKPTGRQQRFDLDTSAGTDHRKLVLFVQLAQQFVQCRLERRLSHAFLEQLLLGRI